MPALVWEEASGDHFAETDHGTYAIHHRKSAGWEMLWITPESRGQIMHPLYFRYDDVAFCKIVAQVHADFIERGQKS